MLGTGLSGDHTDISSLTSETSDSTNTNATPPHWARAEAAEAANKLQVLVDKLIDENTEYRTKLESSRAELAMVKAENTRLLAENATIPTLRDEIAQLRQDLDDERALNNLM